VYWGKQGCGSVFGGPVLRYVRRANDDLGAEQRFCGIENSARNRRQARQQQMRTFNDITLNWSIDIGFAIR